MTTTTSRDGGNLLYLSQRHVVYLSSPRALSDEQVLYGLCTPEMRVFVSAPFFRICYEAAGMMGRVILLVLDKSNNTCSFLM